MPADENTRLQIRQHFIELMDERLADAIMESMPPIPWTDLATKDDIARLDERFESVDQRFDTVDRRFDTVDLRLDTIVQRFDTINQRFDLQTTELQAGMLALEGRLGMRFMEATRLIVFAVLLLMTGVVTAVIAVSGFG